MDFMAQQALFHVSIFLLCFQACTESEAEVKMMVFNSTEANIELKNGLAMNGSTIFTGKIFSLSANQKDTAEIVGFYEGKEHGIWKKFYPNGKVMETREFRNGKKVGCLKAWWPNGTLKLQYSFADGEYNGSCREWNDRGLLIKAMNYRMGYEEGSQKQFYDDGKIKANYIMTGGRRYGLLGTKNCENVADSIFKN